MKKRILYSDNSVLYDWSVNLDNYHSGTHSATFVALEDAIYIGSRLPFNHLYFKLDGSNVNSNASVMTVSYWDSGEFREAVDLIDETSVGGATLAQSGFVTWSSDKDYGWIREDTNYGGNSVTGLTTVEIYDLYWCKITVSANLTAGVSFSWVGQKFSNDNDLGAEYPSLVRSAFIAAYETGKTDWEEQHMVVAELVVDDLIDMGLILEGDQILKRDDLKSSSVSRVAQMIFTGMGDDYSKNRELAANEYKSRLNKVMPRVDLNLNARIDVNERTNKGRLVR
jgi:hypothetical protein